MQGRRIKFLLYHSVLHDITDDYAVSIEMFKAQMAWISENGYCVISMREALELMDSGRLPGKHLVITFDDGFTDFFQNALSVLNMYDFKATIFIVAQEAGGSSSWRTEGLKRTLMDWDMLKRIVDEGHTIGSHGAHHLDLTKLSDIDLDNEIAASKGIIHEKLGIDVEYFSYPWGMCTDREMNSVKKAGYKGAVTVGGRWHNGSETDRYALERISIGKTHSLDAFAKILR
jgi:peptidoglycan/xylan/chitin deacetylase (PgdA/CDA1 family)